MTYTFEPPTYRKIIPSVRGPRISIDQGVSIVRINGSLRVVTRPSPTQLVAAGAEGIDWFIGGHIYQVSVETATELQLAGFDAGVPLGYGASPYGTSPYGD